MKFWIVMLGVSFSQLSQYASREHPATRWIHKRRTLNCRQLSIIKRYPQNDTKYLWLHGDGARLAIGRFVRPDDGESTAQFFTTD